jgi:hypothetical protein
VLLERKAKVVLVLMLVELGITKILEMPSTASFATLAAPLAVLVPLQIVCPVRVLISSRMVPVLLPAQMVSLLTAQIVALVMPIALLARLLLTLPA